MINSEINETTSCIKYEDGRIITCAAQPISSVEELSKENSYLLKVEARLMEVQKKLIDFLESQDENLVVKITRRLNDTENTGGSLSCVIEDAKFVARGGINISVLHHPLSEKLAKYMSEKNLKLLDNQMLDVVGISTIIHCKNPNIPSYHFNVRWFVLRNAGSINGIATKDYWWCGGCTDMSPFIANEKEFKLFHQSLKDVCDASNVVDYNVVKKNCDEYFHLSHRSLHRGIGGIFFDDLTTSQSECYNFIYELAMTNVDNFIMIFNSNVNKTYNEDDIIFQKIRYGHYVEFNLLFDRGTKFGLSMDNPKVENILVSLPPEPKWIHEYTPTQERHKLIFAYLKESQPWINFDEK